MKTGDLDQRVTIEEQSTSADGSGGQTLSWTEFAQAWAHVKPVRLSEEERQGAVRASRGYVFTIRRRGDLDETMRIVWNGQDFNIREIRDPGPRALYMDIMAQSGVTQ